MRSVSAVVWQISSRLAMVWGGRGFEDGALVVERGERGGNAGQVVAQPVWFEGGGGDGDGVGEFVEEQAEGSFGGFEGQVGMRDPDVLLGDRRPSRPLRARRAGVGGWRAR